ncbi:MAG: hypothetical protein A2542_01810 [Parcubacteria group bacterium RIFOXYD2_FULL_52_8]|nr:MAG: hypothetical protein A2542_01810 [Parcubacteria group bacterium RIFOXYD2_FULL_52_8]
MKTVLDRAKSVHFIGIGGSGVSAVARLALLQGKRVSGSDQAESSTTEELKRAGANIYIGHRANNLGPEVDLVVYTIALADNNPELEKAKERQMPLFSYPQILGEISKEMYTIAVAGTHGKTTTTAMVGKLLADAGLDPTVIVGSPMVHAKSNLVVGKSKYLVVEACEYRRSFLQLSPKILVITNIDRDHLDYYEDLADIQKAFCEFVSKLDSRGTLVCAAEDERLRPVLAHNPGRLVDYRSFASLTSTLKLRLPGAHNQWNAQAAAAAGSVLKISPNMMKRSLRSFRGTKRRLEYKGVTAEGTVVYDDYGHAPAEVRATLAALRELFPEKHITIVFQPHLYSRTKLLLEEFGTSFVDADHTVITDIFAARESLDTSIHSKDLVARIKDAGGKASYVENFMHVRDLLRERELRTDVLLIEGAGSISTLASSLVEVIP